MFSVAFFSLASLALSALASPLALNGLPHVPDSVDKVAHHKTHDTVSDGPHVRRHDPVSCLTAFLQAFDGPLTTVEDIVNRAPNAAALSAEITPALYGLIKPMTAFVGQIVEQSGVSAQDSTVTVDAQQTVQTVNGYAARLTTCLNKASDMVSKDFPETVLVINTAATLFNSVVYLIGIVSGITYVLLEPVLNSLVPLVSKLGACTTSSLGL